MESLCTLVHKDVKCALEAKKGPHAFPLPTASADSCVVGGGGESEAMRPSAKMKQWPHAVFPDSSILPVMGGGPCRSRQGCPCVNGTPEGRTSTQSDAAGDRL